MVNSRTVPGWKLNVDNGRWNHPESKLECNYEYNGGWIGYTNSGDGSISTTLNAIGQKSPIKGKLKFGNCKLNGGQVVAYLDGNEIGRASANKKENVDFYFNHGSTLELVELNGGIIHFLDFKVLDCIQGNE